MKKAPNNRYSSIPKRSYRNSIIRLIEEEYKIVGSHKVINLIAADIVKLHKEFYPDQEKQALGTLTWRTTKKLYAKPGYGKKAEDYEVVTVHLPLIIDEDVNGRLQEHHRGYGIKKESPSETSRERDMRILARLTKSAYEQGGLLTGAELSVLMNRSLTTISKIMKRYHEAHNDILPTKGTILDQGSRPTHKGSIINLFEQGYPEPDIARIVNHSIEATSRYLKEYKKVKMLISKGFNLMEMVRVTGRGRSTILQYRELVYTYHPELEEINKNNLEKEVGKAILK